MELYESLSKLIDTKELWGVVTYKIVGDGCLNGLWTNNYSSQSLMNEIGRRLQKYNDNDNISGDYTSAYIENNGTAFTGELKIQKKETRIYKLKWSHINIKGTSVEYEGVGMEVGINQLVAIYWQTNR